MIDVKEAILKAKEYAANVLDLKELMLEEVESDDRFFKVTISFPRRTLKQPELVDRHGAKFGPDPFGKRYDHRDYEYKTLSVRKDTGEIASMSIRIVG